MKKLKLDLDQLAVASFRTDGGDGLARGTVRGRSDTYIDQSCDPTCVQIGGACGS